MAATQDGKAETKVTAEFEQNTKGGKRRYRIEDNAGVTGTIYVAPGTPNAEHDKLALDIRPAV